MKQTKMFTFIWIKFVFLLALLTLEFVVLQTSNFCFLFIWKMNTFPWILSHYCTAAPLNVNLSEPVIPEFGCRNLHKWKKTHTGSGIVWLTQNGEKNNLFFFLLLKITSGSISVCTSGTHSFQNTYIWRKNYFVNWVCTLTHTPYTQLFI